MNDNREEAMRFFLARWEQRAKDEGYESVEDYSEAVWASFKAHINEIRRTDHMFDNGENAYKSDLKLGERYRDQATGIEGVLTSIHFYQHACERGTIRYVNGQQDVIEASFDAPELVHIESGKTATTERKGGPARSEGRRIF